MLKIRIMSVREWELPTNECRNLLILNFARLFGIATFLPNNNRFSHTLVIVAHLTGEVVRILPWRSKLLPPCYFVKWDLPFESRAIDIFFSRTNVIKKSAVENFGRSYWDSSLSVSFCELRETRVPCYSLIVETRKVHRCLCRTECWISVFWNVSVSCWKLGGRRFIFLFKKHTRLSFTLVFFYWNLHSAWPICSPSSGPICLCW